MVTLFKCEVIRSGAAMSIKHEVGKITGIKKIVGEPVGAGGATRPVAEHEDGRKFILNF